MRRDADRFRRVRELPHVVYPRGSLLIADLHLDPGQASAAQPLAAFLALARGAPRLAILGDLFDAWIGPAHAALPGARAAIEALAAIAREGTAIDVIVGNRDFLLDASFERATGARVHRHGFIAEIGAARWLAIHGDELCSLDHDYQRMKRVLRSPAVLAIAPAVPRPLALAIARRLRGASTRAIARKPSAEKAQQEGDVEREAGLHGCSGLICGHAHEFRDQRMPLGTRWVVLDAFGGDHDVARVGASGEIRFGSRDRVPAA